tara:strand:+ start:293 stop:553 length:261 start_codon:yes stop_codon:yes gene_type:complete
MATKSINQKRGPTTGNAGNSAKVSAFNSEKSGRSSYMKTIADTVISAVAARGRAMAPNQPAVRDAAALKEIHPNTRTRNGPTKGNK